MRAAQKLKIPVIVHEQNAYPGVTTKMLSKKAEYVMLAVEEARKHFDSNVNFVLTGNPIRPEILRVNKEEAKAKKAEEKAAAEKKAAEERKKAEEAKKAEQKKLDEQKRKLREQNLRRGFHL